MNQPLIAIYTSEVKIGTCVGCSENRPLLNKELDACGECLNSSKRGPKWIELARRVHKDPIFARRCFDAMKNSEMKDQFLLRFGRNWLRSC